jgi:hypothetical protein
MKPFFRPMTTRPLRLRGTAIPALGLGLAALLLALMMGQDAPPAGAAAPNRANVVVQFDGEARVVRTVEFDAPLSGLKALELSGVEVVTRTTSFGDVVCSIGGVGCPAEDCFCSASYWSYWYLAGADWQSYDVGAGSSVISQTGAVEGWRWGQFGATLVPVTPSLQAQDAFAWLAARQTITGDYGGVGATVETVLALGANSQHNERANRYLEALGAAYSNSGAAAAGKLAVALAGTDACLAASAVSLAGYFSPTLGAYSTQSGDNAWALLGAVAGAEPVPPTAVAHLAAQIQPSGGWEWAPGWGADTNATALALQALIAAGEPITASAVISGLVYLDGVQNADGGFPYAGGLGAGSDVNSTAYVVQALVAAGENPRAPRWTAPGGDPFAYLATMQLADGGFEWQAGTGANQLATQQAIPALLGQPYPAQRRTIPSCPALYLPLVSQE